jgi:hypothetical protein
MQPCRSPYDDPPRSEENIILVTDRQLIIPPRTTTKVPLLVQQHDLDVHTLINIQLTPCALPVQLKSPPALNWINDQGKTHTSVTNQSTESVSFEAGKPLAYMARAELYMFNDQANHFLQHVSLLHEDNPFKH